MQTSDVPQSMFAVRNGVHTFDAHMKIAAWMAGGGLFVLALSPFFRWIQFGAGGVTGISHDGKLVVGASVLAIAAYLAAVVAGKCLTPVLLGVQAWGTVATFWMGALLWRVCSILDSPAMKDNPFAALLATQLSAGTGLYLGLIGGLAVAGALGYVVVRRTRSVGGLKPYCATQGFACMIGILLAISADPDRPITSRVAESTSSVNETTSQAADSNGRRVATQPPPIKRATSVAEDFEGWVSGKKAGFRMVDKERVLSSIASLPDDPAVFEEQVESVLKPLRQKCEQAIAEVREKADPIRKELTARLYELERKRMEFELSERSASPLATEIFRREQRIVSLVQDFERHVRTEYEALYTPTVERYNALRKARADEGILWRYESNSLLKRYFVCGSVILLQCGAPDQYREFDRDAESEKVIALDAATGKERWVAALNLKHTGRPPWITAATAVGDKVFIAADGRQVIAFDANSGARLWMYTLPDHVTVTSLREVAGRLLIIGSDTGPMPILVLPSEDGQFTEFLARGTTNLGSPAVLDCFMKPEHRPNWVAIDALTLKPLYTQEQLIRDLRSQDEELSSVMTRLDRYSWDSCWRALRVTDELIVLYAYGRGYLLERKTNALRRLFDYESYHGVHPIIAGNRVFYVTSDGALKAWDLAKNKQAWSTERRFDTRNPHGRNRLHTDGEVVVYAETGRDYLVNGTGFYGIDAATGKEIWRKRLDMDMADIDMRPGHLVLLQNAEKVHIANAKTGQIVWSQELPVRLEKLEAARDEADAFLFGNQQASISIGPEAIWTSVAREGKVECFLADTGKPSWSDEILPLRVTLHGHAGRPPGAREYAADWSVFGRYFFLASFAHCSSFIDQYDVQQVTKIVDGTTGAVVLQYQHFGDLPERGDIPAHWDQFGLLGSEGLPSEGVMVQRLDVREVQFKDFRLLPSGTCLCRNSHAIKALKTHIGN